MKRPQVEQRPASGIAVNQFRLLYQWPLVLDKQQDGIDWNSWVKTEIDALKAKMTAKNVSENKPALWQKVSPHDIPDRLTEPSGEGDYGEFVYFHDFTQKFLYETDEKKAAFSLYQRTDLTELHATVSWKTGNHPNEVTHTQIHHFCVDRLTLHVFDLGVAMLTLELSWGGQVTNGKFNQGPLFLDSAQRILDHLRRSYAPFWSGDTPQRVPSKVTLWSGPGVCQHFDPMGKESPNNKSATLARFRSSDAKTLPSRDPLVFGHWAEMIKPITLLAQGGPWRDPSDERIPFNSYILIADQGKPDEALLRIKPGDWHRIMDADQPGTDAYPYNPHFVEPMEKSAYYDRFFPDVASGSTATRHIFGGTHYSLVGAGLFVENLSLNHWRRHYAQLSLIARFEMTVLLAVSSRISGAVTAFHLSGNEKAFDDAIMDTQQYFLRFVHRFRFTGVTSQLQGAEMFEMWRKTLHLDELFADVKSELDIATAAVNARQQLIEAKAATRLAKIASVGVVGGLIVGALGSNVVVGVFDKETPLFALHKVSQLGQVALITGGVLVLAAAAALVIFSDAPKTQVGRDFKKHWWLWLAVAGVLFAACGWFLLPS